MKEWQECALGDVITLQRGFDLPADERKPGPVPIVSSSGIMSRHAEAKMRAPGVVTGRYGTVGQVFYITEDYWPLNTTLFVKDFKGNDPRYVSYLLRTIDFASYSDKSSVPGVNRNHLHLARVRVPKPNEQRAIAGVLGALDDKIELNRRMNETLEAIAQAEFRRMMAEGGGTKVVPLPDAIEVNPTRPLRKGEVAPYLDMANMPTHAARALEVYDREFGSGMRFMDGDTLVARITPCLENGKTCFVDFLGGGKVGWGSTEYIVLRPKPPLPVEYAYFLARTEDFRNFAISNMTGTSGRQRVPADCFNHFQVQVPALKAAERFGQFARIALTKMKANDEESRTLAGLRDALLPKLLSGAARVRPGARRDADEQE